MAEVVEIGAKKPQAERLAEFNKGLEALCLQHGFKIGAEPFVEEGAIKVRVVVADADAAAKEEGGGGVKNSAEGGQA